MDYFSKTPIRLLFLILIIPTLLWGYGKAIVRFAQITNNAIERGDKAVDSVADRDRVTESNHKTNSAVNEETLSGGVRNHQATDGSNALPQLDGALIQKSKRYYSNGGDSASVSQMLDGELNVKTDKSLEETKIVEKPSDTVVANPEKIKARRSEKAQPEILEPKVDLDIPKKPMKPSDGKIEPVGESTTYSNRVLKPIIPVSTRTTDERNISIGPVETNTEASVIRVLGIPTILFTGLFFVMWGIISGRIQRIMF